MMTGLRFVALATPLCCLTVMLGCPGADGPDAGWDDGGLVRQCASSAECADGFVCAGGACLVGECLPELLDACRQEGGPPEDVEPYCCKRWELCNFDYTCTADPNSPVGFQCEESLDCANPGDFCSGGTCYPSGGRDPCTASFQCPTGQRCDRTVFLCVPDIGGCELCDELPELCCEADQLCDEETGFCVSVDAECDGDEDCLPGRTCDPFGRCVQCVTDDDCGPGTSCNEGTGNCISNVFSCETDDDCMAPRLCAPLTSECVNPQCVGNAQCAAEDPRAECDLNTYTCFLPSADCEETDEPNDAQATASMMSVGTDYTGTLCRGNTDYVGFPIVGDKRYQVTVSIPDYNGGGLQVGLIAEGGGQLDTDTFSTFETDVTVVGVTDPEQTGMFFVRVTGSGDDADLWNYTISVVESQAPITLDCTDEIANGIEPNDDFAGAYDIMPNTAYTFARCDGGDNDYYRIEVPPQSGLDVTIEFDDDSGDLALEIFDGMSADDRLQRSDGVSDVERVEVPEGGTVFWIRVALWSTSATGLDGQAYTLTAALVPRPDVCDDDPDEPGNDGVDGASVLVPNMVVQHRQCVPVDVDNHSVTVPANFGGEVTVAFNHFEGDLRLDLYSSDQMLLDSSNISSGANAVETLELPFSSQEETYIARVRRHTPSGDVGQPYTISATTYDASTCVASEPLSNNSPAEGRCVGQFASTFPCIATRLSLPMNGPDLATCDSAPGTEGCGTLCGASDADWYRVGVLNNGQLLAARLEYDPGDVDAGPSPGRMGLALARANPALTAATYVQYEPNIANNGVVQLQVSVPAVAEPYAREYMVVVLPEGNEGFAAQPYSLDISVGAPCVPDAYEPNADPSQSTGLRTSGTPGVAHAEDVSGTLCSFDTDVYELFGFVGETITATVLGPDGITVDIGSRPTPITDPPPVLAAGAPVGGACPIDVNLDAGVVDGGAVADGTNCQQATLVNDEVRQLYLVVHRDEESLDSVGAYILRLEVQ
jgi:hypothetical protein